MIAARRHDDISTSFDPWLIGLFIALTMFGLVMVYSATLATTSASLTGTRIFWKQLTIALAGTGVLLFVAKVPIGLWSSLDRVLVLLGFVMLAIVIIPGVAPKINGATRWLVMGSIRIQPSELFKIIFVIYLASYLNRRCLNVRDFWVSVGVPAIVFGLSAMLLLAEPDFGTTVVLAVTGGTMLFLGGMRLIYCAVCLSSLGIGVALMVLIAPYRMQRFTVFWDPWEDKYDTGYQLTQALIAFGRGEWFGVGLGSSIQKMLYLPHANNDFLVSIIAEELGLVGIFAVIALFLALAWRAFFIANRALQYGAVFEARLAQGLGVLISFQAVVNLGVNMGALPTKGLTLPFMSSGGSSFIASCFALGLLIAIERSTRARPRRQI